MGGTKHRKALAAAAKARMGVPQQSNIPPPSGEKKAVNKL